MGNLTASVKFNSERMYVGGNIYNLSSDFSLENNELKVSVNGSMNENIKAELNASAIFGGAKS